MVGCVRVKLYCAVVVPHQVIWDTLPQTQNINLSIQSEYSYSKGILVNFIVVLLRLPVMTQNLERHSEAYQVLGAGSRCQTLVLYLLQRLQWQSLTLKT